MKSHPSQKGFTLIELVVTMAIAVVITIAVATFFKSTLSFNRSIFEQLNTTGDARRTLKTIVAEVRIASPSGLGAYPLAQVATSSLIFYSNVDDDTAIERVRYYLSSKKLMRGVVNPTGNPLVYNLGQEVVSQVTKNVVNNNATPVFTYYDGNYSGTQSALSGNFNIAAVRLVKINLVIDQSGVMAADSDVFTSQVSLRNLKDNL